MCPRPALLLAALLVATPLLAPAALAQPGDADRALLGAATTGDADALRQALAAGASPEAADTAGATALMRATRSGTLAAVRTLVEAGADPTRKGTLWLNEERTSYYGNLTGIAAAEGHTDVLAYLLDTLGIPVDDRERDPATGEDTGWTALQWAAFAGQTEAARMLLDRGAVRDRPGDALLVLAIRDSHGATARALLDAGAPATDADLGGWTPLHWAAARLPAAWVGTLVDAGADVNARGKDGHTPLTVAALVGDADFARLLVCAGAKGAREAKSVAEEQGHDAAAAFLGGVAEQGPPTAAACANAEARVFYQQAEALYRAGRYAEAIPWAEDLLHKQEATAGPDHPDVARSLNNLAVLLDETRDYAGAHALYERALAIREATLSPDHPDVATSLNNLAQLLVETGDHAGARPLYERALAIREAALGPDHPDVASTLNGLAGLLRAMGDNAGAQERYERALALREKAFGPDHLDVATSLNNLAELLHAIGDYTVARRLYERSLTIREATLGPDHPDVANSLNNLAGLLKATGDYTASRLHYERALAIREATLGPDHPDVANSLNNLAGLLQAAGDYVAARPLHERALAISEAALGPDHPDVATSLNNLAFLLRATGDYAAARPLHERALAISEAAFGPNHPDVAISLNNLATLLESTSDYAAARPLYERALAISEAAFGPDHPDVATSLNNLALLLDSIGDYAAARPLYERALAIREAKLGPDHSDVASSLNNLAGLLKATGDYDTARPLLERALAIDEAAYGPNHPDVAISLNNLALLLRATGDYAAARPLLERALAVNMAVFGPAHPAVAINLNNLATLLESTSEAPAARPLRERAAHLSDARLPLLLPTLSFAEQAAYLQGDLAGQTSALLSSHRTPEHLRTAYPLLARWKGLLLHSLRAQTAVAALADDPAHADDVAALQAARTNLAAWQDRAGSVPLVDWRARHDTLTAEKERLERTLAAALPEDVFTDPLRAENFPGLPASLASDETFADVFRYAYHERGDFVERRYAVVLSTPEEDPRLVDLGHADSLDAAIAAWREAVTATRAATAEQQGLAERLWAPLAEALPAGTTRLWLSPDGALARLPLSVLAETHPRTADLLVSRVASARAFVRLHTAEHLPDDTERLPADGDSADGVLLAGAVAFGTDSTGAARPFAPLPGTATEVDALAALARDAGQPTTTLTGPDVTPEAIVAALPRARVVHLATHGFFARLDQTLLDTAAEAGLSRGLRGGFDRTGFDRTGFARSGTLSGAATPPPAVRRELARNPLVESGLALAGANAGAQGRLTAEELVGLDLTGTDLVVLSACETGRGSEVTGQGVLGLQASFLAAGARTLLMSLWKVPDASTALLMEAFYRGLWEESWGTAEALRRAQAKVRAAGYTAPVHWAAWVLAGEAW